MTPAEWTAYLAGYERGIATGYDRGAQDIVDDLKRAGAALAEWMPDVRRQIDVNAARRAQTPAGAL